MQDLRDDEEPIDTMSAVLSGATAKINAADQSRDVQTTSQQTGSEVGHLYTTATTETARMLINQQQTLSRMIAEDDEEIAIISARRADRFKAFDALNHSLKALQ